MTMEADWREIIKSSQKELRKSEKEKLCENLSWLDADDIELNFSDLKTLFKLCQDVLKYKTEQVNNLLGKTRKKIKTKERSTLTDSPALSSDSVLETIAHQEEVIKANKEVLEQLYADIAELEERKSKHKNNLLQDSDSSPNTLSEINTIAHLESEVTKRNKHIKKLLGDVKILEEENTSFRHNLSVFKEKLKEATLLIENLTEQLFALNKNATNLKEHLGRAEQEKTNLQMEIENLKEGINDKDLKYEKVEVDVKNKVQQLKNLLKGQSEEIARLKDENTQLKADFTSTTKEIVSPKTRKILPEESKIKELQEKLSEASNEIMKSASLIKALMNENAQLKLVIDDVPDNSLTEQKNESDDGKEKNMIIKLKKKNRKLSDALRCSEEMLAVREKDIAEAAEQLQLLRSDEGINTLLASIKNKKKDLRMKDETIKNLVIEVNNLNQFVNDLQLENETMREKLQIPLNEQINSRGVLKKYRDLITSNTDLTKKIEKYENKLISFEIDNHEKEKEISKLKTILKTVNLNEVSDEHFTFLDEGENRDEQQSHISSSENIAKVADVQAIIEENEGLRNGLTEILNFLKDNSNASSGLLEMKCPSLDAVLNSMEARKSAGWFSPHMKTVMELKSALGSKDALLCALHESRNETFKVMEKLNEEERKSSELVKTLQEVKDNTKKESEDIVSNVSNISIGEFGSWMKRNNYDDVDLNSESEIQNIVTKGNVWFENQFKQVIQYFHNKFTILFDKFTALTINAANDHNKWSIKEEHYKAEIENLKSQIDEHEDDTSNLSPGLISMNKSSSSDRKYIFLEDSYKQIRTLNENIKNEYLESKKERLNEAYKYEQKIQNLIQSVINLSDQLRNSVPLELFLKQNNILNNSLVKYRHAIETISGKNMYSEDLLKRLEQNKFEIVEKLRKEIQESNEAKRTDEIKLNNEHTILQKQLQDCCIELQNKNIQIDKLEKNILELQTTQSEIINKTIHVEPRENIDFLKEQVKKLNEENIVLKKQYQNIESQLNATILEVQTYKNKEVCNEKEIYMLRHQILDLQSTTDTKATIARIGGEVLLAQMQSSENQSTIESLKLALNKEKELRAETEEILFNRQKVFDIYTLRYNNSLRNTNEILNILRQQYQGCLPLISLETFIQEIEEVKRKSEDFNEKLNEIEDLQSSLMTKHSVYNQILDLSSTKCLEDGDICQHKIKNIITGETQKLETEHYRRKIESLEQSRKELKKRCDLLEKTLICVNQGFKISDRSSLSAQKEHIGLEVIDIPSDDDTSSRKSRTQTLSNPKIDIQRPNNIDDNKEDINNRTNFENVQEKKTSQNQHTQTFLTRTDVKLVQTEADRSHNKLNSTVENLLLENKQKDRIIEEINATAKQHAQEIWQLNKEKNEINTLLKNLSDSNKHKDDLNKKQLIVQESLKQEINNLKTNKLKEINMLNETINAENQTLLMEIKKIENDKNNMINDYKKLLSKERDDYSNSLKSLQLKLKDLQTKLDERASQAVASDSDVNKETNNKFTEKIYYLEEKCFKLQSELDGYKGDFENQKSELERWQNLASERLNKMEQLSAQLKERHALEVDSYRAENQHWLTQLKETQREHIELRARLTEQKTLHIKQMTEKDNHIEQLRTVVNSLKTQILNMQTMLTINDPSFDLSAIVEVGELSDAASQPGSDRLELKFESTVDFSEAQEEFAKLPCSSTAIWQEPLLERLRREKQLMGKQNAILRRQVKVLAARERRSRLDAQNLRNQVFRITTGNKVPSAESAALQSTVATLQAQLASARRDAGSGVALWDKWKRAQQAADRWQARYEEKCQEVKKLETSLNLSKSAVNRLEKEKRILLSRLGEEKHEKQMVMEKQEAEAPEKESSRSERCLSPPVSSRALLGRVEAQQRRIAALEIAERGNETLVSEYEKSLAEITSLKGQVLKLESTLLEAQIRTPLQPTTDALPELQYWRNYCDMLKEENMQLTLKVNSMENAPTSAHQQRVNDLEQTVLTLRGLVSKLQADNKSSSTSILKRVDSRPGSGRGGSDKVRTQMESHRIEISNLKRSILEKDALLEKSKEMLKIAAEREDELLRENMLLRRRLEQLTEGKEGFISA